jgi:hypothetical protein
MHPERYSQQTGHCAQFRLETDGLSASDEGSVLQLHIVARP